MNVMKAKYLGSNLPRPFDAGALNLALNDMVVVEGERGPMLAKVCDPPAAADNPGMSLPKTLRTASPDDIDRSKKNKALETDTFNTCRDLIRQKSLPMKLVRVEYVFDGSKIIFYFTAEGRVDFRELVRDLAQRYRTRIEMMQIGVRDGAKAITGVGVCGRTICCSTFLQVFSPVSIKMAKDQNLSLNPSKVSGVCGRLMCCLSYEHEVYREFVKDKPKVGKRCTCPEGCGKVSRHDPLRGKIYVMLEDGREVAFEPDEVKRVAYEPAPKKPRPEGEETAGGEEAVDEAAEEIPESEEAEENGLDDDDSDIVE
jgi:cell fate regulator YaaT (PSP1 superfamily)